MRSGVHLHEAPDSRSALGQNLSIHLGRSFGALRSAKAHAWPTTAAGRHRRAINVVTTRIALCRLLHVVFVSRVSARSEVIVLEIPVRGVSR
jgi:hypothetical protein